MDVARIKVRRQRRRSVYRLPISSAATCKWLPVVKSTRDTRHLAASQRRRRCPCSCESELKDWLVDSTAYEEDDAPASFSQRHRACAKCQEDFGSTSSSKSDSLEGSPESSDVEPSGATTDESNECGQVQSCVSKINIEVPLRCIFPEGVDAEFNKGSHIVEGHDNKDTSLAANNKWQRAVKNDRRPRAPQKRRRRSSTYQTNQKERFLEHAVLSDKDDVPDNSSRSNNASGKVVHIFKENVEHTTNYTNKSLESSPVELSVRATVCGLVKSTAPVNESEVSPQDEVLERPFVENMHFVEDLDSVNGDSLHAENVDLLHLGSLNVNRAETSMYPHNSIITDLEQDKGCLNSESNVQYTANTTEHEQDNNVCTLAFSILPHEKQELSEELLDFITEAELRNGQNTGREVDGDLPENLKIDFIEQLKASGESIDDHKDILIHLVREIKVSNSPDPVGDNSESSPVLETKESTIVVDTQHDTGCVRQLFPEDNDLQSGYQESVTEESQYILEAQDSQNVVKNQPDSGFVKQIFPEDKDLKSGYEECIVEKSQCILEAQENETAAGNQADSVFVKQTFTEDNNLQVGYEECVVEESQCLEDFILLDEDEMQMMLTLPVGADGLPAANVSAGAAPGDGCVGPQGDGPTAPSANVDLEESSMLLSEAELKLASDIIQEELDAIAATPAGEVGDLLHFDNVHAALDAIESGGGDGRQAGVATAKTTPTAPVRMGSGVQSEVERAARALFSKRTSTLYQWMYPGTPKKKLKATVTRSWDTLPESEKLFYMSQVMGRFGTPAGSLMVNPQLAGLSTEQMETERAVAGLLASESPKIDDWDPVSLTLRSTPRKRVALSTRKTVREKKSRGARRKLTDLVDSCEDEITPAELFAPLGI